MGITKKTEYALRALYEISIAGNAKPVSRKSICKKQKISEPFLERILIDLLKANITRSVRGPGGGFILNKEPAEITVWDVFSAVENPVLFYGKCTLLKEEECELYKKCRIKHIWPKINQTLRKTMSSISLYDISQPVSAQRSRKVKSTASFSPGSDRRDGIQ